MGLSASQGRMLLLTARRNDLEFRAQQISQRRLLLSQQLEEIAMEYERATSNRQMKITTYQYGTGIDPTKAQDRDENLTYRAFISGLVGLGITPEQSGIQPSSTAMTQGRNYGYTSTTAYRVVDVNGAIVVSDKSEIPLSLNIIKESDAESTNINNDKDNMSAYFGIDKDGKSFAGLIPPKDSDMYKAFFGDKDGGGTIPENYELLYDTESGRTCVKYKDDDGKDVCMVFEPDGSRAKKAGSEDYITSQPSGTWKENDNENSVYIIDSEKSTNPPKNYDIDSKEVDESTTYDKNHKGYQLVEGNDGLYTLYYDGKEEQRYVVDEALKQGGTDAAGQVAGPNYFQECLRNGKYYVEQYIKDENNDDGYRWSSVSWDATVNIKDSYYQEDDDAAKAKYDRLQNQIQAQDKKLELELDQIETQRQAITTEEESVKKVINENIEGTFNAFG